MRERRNLQPADEPADDPASDPDFAYRSEAEDTDLSSDNEFDAQETLDNWMLTLRLEQRKMLAVNLMKSFQQPPKKEAATEAGSIVGFSEKSV